MVNRRRSVGFFLILFSSMLMSACNGGSSSNQTAAEETQTSTADVETNPDTIPAPDAVKIMAIGDSITQGDSNHQSYRYELWKKLVDTGVPFDLQGSLQGNFKGDPSWPEYKSLTFDRDHEGHWGWRVDEILSEVNQWLDQNTPDVALVHLGTNDVFQQQSINSTLSELTELVARLRVKNPKIKVILAEVIPSKQNNSKLNELNSGIVTLAEKLNSSESPIYLVDMGVGFDPNTDTYDGVHPNQSGEEKMAAIWFDGLMLMDMFR